MTVKVNRVVWPFLPSALVTSLMLMRGSSSTMVPTPWPSAMVALVGLLRLTTKVSFGSPSRSPLTSTVIVLLVSAGGEGQRAARRPGSRCRPWRCRRRWRRRRSSAWLEAADRVTVKVAVRVPVLPSVTVTSRDGNRRGARGGPVRVVEEYRDGVGGAFATATSGRPSPLKSAAATADSGAGGDTGLGCRVPSPLPSRTTRAIASDAPGRACRRR